MDDVLYKFTYLLTCRQIPDQWTTHDVSDTVHVNTRLTDSFTSTSHALHITVYTCHGYYYC